MSKIHLNGKWQMSSVSAKSWIDAEVPGSVLQDLLRAGRIDDPFFRDNEDKALALSYDDYVYKRDFYADDELLAHDRVLLRCEGLDTLAEIRINGAMIAATDNMHRTYEWDVKDKLLQGNNAIEVTLLSPTAYITAKQQENPLWGVVDAVPGFTHIRKAHSMFGWDWGPQMPDAGIWRDIMLLGYSAARIDDVYVTQQHAAGSVELNCRYTINKWSEQAAELHVLVIDPHGLALCDTTVPVQAGELNVACTISEPQLWWPVGYGEQPLYRVEATLRSGGAAARSGDDALGSGGAAIGSGEVALDSSSRELDRASRTIGLRTIGVRREKDEWGESFEIAVNGLSIFTQGANYIPEDNLLGRRSVERTEQLIRDCIEANFNCIRIWGGGYYPDDYFFDLCDRYGLIVWQDFMFACGVYEYTKEFAASVRQEAIDNIRRIRHHASLALWCGNNEVEAAWVDWGFPKTHKHRTDYLRFFEMLLPDVVEQYDPQTFYWPSSPSSGGSFDNPNDESRGDVHYWQVWHGLKPFTEYRKFHFRFCSEFGFQSFPGMKTVKSFTLPEDRNIFSYMMEKHQKNGAANGKILFYLSDNFKYPNDFESLLYTSQILQAEAIRYGVEHWRRNRGRCMGSIYWQLNDCWPAASWSSIDCYGRWKALHYFAKRFYAPVLLSAQEDDRRVELHVTNETRQPLEGTIRWALRDNAGRFIRGGEAAAAVAPLSAALEVSLDFADELQGKAAHGAYVEFALHAGESEGQSEVVVSSGTLLFVKPKHFDWLDPRINVEISDAGESFAVTLRAEAFAKYVELELEQADCRFSDNYFDLSAESRTVTVNKASLSEPLALDQFVDQLRVRSIYDIA